MQDTLVIRQARWKIAIGVLAASVFVFAGCLAYVDAVFGGSGSGKDLMLGLSTPIPALCLLWQLSCLLQPVEVHLNREGFQIIGFRATPRIRWVDLDKLTIWRMRGNKLVWFTLRMPAARQMPLGGSLPSQMSRSAESMLSTMKDWQARYGHPDSLLAESKPSGLRDCIAPGAVARGEAPVIYAYRETPHSDFDSGWRFFAADRDEALLADAEDRAVADLGHICERDPDLHAIIEAPIGSAFEREDVTGAFRPATEVAAA